MSWRDLNPPPRKVSDMLARRIEDASHSTVPGDKDLTGSEVIFLDADGSEKSLTGLDGDVKEVKESLADINSARRQLEQGIATASKYNTVASKPPTTIEGFPDGAIWTVVEVGPPLREKQRFVLTRGAWREAGLDAGRIVAGSIDAGLIDVVALAAKMITSNLIKTGDTGERVSLNREGIQVWGVDDDGQDYLRTALGTGGDDVFASGDTHINKAGVVTPSIATNSMIIDGMAAEDFVAMNASKAIAYGKRVENTQWCEPDVLWNVLEMRTRLEKGRLYRIESTPVRTYFKGRKAGLIIAELWWQQDNRSAPDWQRLTSATAYMPGGVMVCSAHPTWTVIDTSSWHAARDVWIQLRMKSANDSFAIDTGAKDKYAGDVPTMLLVTDLGLPTWEVGQQNWEKITSGKEDTAGGGSSGAHVRTQTFNSSGARSFYVSNGRNADKSDVIQGSYNGSAATNRAGVWTFNAYETLRGATIKSAYLTIKVDHTYNNAGGTLRVGGHGYGVLPGSKPGIRNFWSGWVRAGQTVRVPIPIAYARELASGSIRGAGVETGSTSVSEYIRCAASASLTVTYSK